MLFALLLGPVLTAAAQQPAPPAEENKSPPFSRVVVATVDGQPIYAGEVDRHLDRVVRDRPIEAAALKTLQAQAVAQLVDRRLILAYLAEKRLGASGQDIDLAVERISRQLAGRNMTLDDYYKSSGLDLPLLRDTLAWQLGWQRYLDRYLTDENLEKFFARGRREFDGSEVRVAHILWKVEPPDDPAALAGALAKAQSLAQEIAAGKVTFADAARQHSQAPTAAAGGDIGFITRRESMPEAFAAAAFALDKGQIGGPVATAFGVHLIQCLEIKPGTLTWRDVRPEVERAATEFLFQWTADQQRPTARIEFTGALPHYKPGTSEVED